VVRSRDLSTAMGILVSLKLFVYLLPGYLDSSASCSPELHAARQQGRARQRHVDGLHHSMGLLIKMLCRCSGAAVHHAGRMVPGGWVIAPELEPKSA
jgi:flagellar biosynthetic protein FlhB